MAIKGSITYLTSKNTSNEDWLRQMLYLTMPVNFKTPESNHKTLMLQPVSDSEAPSWSAVPSDCLQSMPFQMEERTG